MTIPSEREYAVYRRGSVRELILAHFREGLRSSINPETGEPVTEEEIRIATAKGGRWWTEAEADDLVVMGCQKANEHLANQIRIDRAGTAFLDGYHGDLWGEPRLPAFGGSGKVEARGLPGMTWPGSTTVPNNFAVYGRDGASNRFQVLITAVADDDGLAILTVGGIDGGSATNLQPGTEIRWVNPPPGAEPTGTTLSPRFTGGADAETDAAYSARLASRPRHKPASANWAHLRAFARSLSVSVEDAFVYSSAFHAGSELVCVLQKRGDTLGPLARVPSVSVLAVVTLGLVPPSSALVPGRAHVVVVPPQTQASNAVLGLAQPFGSVAGWADVEPFPKTSGAAVAVVLVTNQQDFRVSTTGTGLLPGGASSAAGVSMMVWDAPTSSFVSLAVQTVTDVGGGQYRVQLSAPAAGHTIAVGDWVSPGMSRHDILAEAVTAYFDTLGPGEVINLATDTRGGRAFRNPVPNEERPSRAGQGIVGKVSESLGSLVGDAQLISMSVQTPSVPTDPVLGPNLIVAGKVAVYALE